MKAQEAISDGKLFKFCRGGLLNNPRPAALGSHLFAGTVLALNMQRMHLLLAL